jgi:integrase
MESFTVKHRSVSITVYPWTHPTGRQYWRFKRNDGKHVTRASLDDAKREAKEHAASVHRGTLDLETLSPEQLRVLRRIIDADPSLRIVDEFLLWHGRKAPKKLLSDARDEFIAAKQNNRGASHHNLQTLSQHLKHLPGDMMLADIGPNDLPPVTGAPRTRHNRIAAWITFFKWCRDREWLPHGEKTAPEKLERPIVVRSIPATYTPQELKILLDNVRDQYRPWLALCAWGGLRTEEVIPQQGSRKKPLQWSDIDLKRKIITVRPETAKTGDRRVIPICPALLEVLRACYGSGPIGPHLYPSKPSTHGSLSETTRLGKLIGGWKRNALRHSFISYRAALVGIAQTSMEAGNSESEARRSYNDAKTKAEARKWFGVRCSPDVLRFQKPRKTHDAQNFL